MFFSRQEMISSTGTLYSTFTLPYLVTGYKQS